MIDQPQNYDVTLGGKAYPLTPLKKLNIKDLEEIKILLAGGYIERKILALKEALKYGEDGFNLIINALNDPSPKVTYMAYQLLSHAQENYGKKALSKYYDWETPKISLFQTLEGHNNKITAISFNYDQGIIVSASSDKSIKIWSLNTGQEYYTLRDHYEVVSTVDISDNGKILVSGSHDKTLKVWDLENGALIGTITGHCAEISTVKITKNGQSLISGSKDQTIKIWNLQTGNLIHTLEGHQGIIKQLKLIDETYTIISLGADNQLKLWNGYTGKELKTIKLDFNHISCFDLSADHQYLACGNQERIIKVFNWENQEEILTLSGHNQTIHTLAFSPGGWPTLISGSMDKTIKIWHLKTGQEIRSLEAHSGAISDLIISQDWQYILSASDDQTIGIWKVVFQE